MARAKKGHIDPDGVLINVRWDLLEKDMSVFIPCVNTVRAMNQVKYISRTLDIKLKSTVRIERGRYGIRVWRT